MSKQNIRTNESNTLQDRLSIIGKAARLDDVNNFTANEIGGVTSADLVKLEDLQEYIDNAYCASDEAILPSTSVIITDPASGTNNVNIVQLKSGFKETSIYRLYSADQEEYVAVDWELATDGLFNNIVDSTYNDRENIWSWNPICSNNTTYWARMRLRIGMTTSEWSVPISFTTGSSVRYVGELGSGTCDPYKQGYRMVGNTPGFIVNPPTTTQGTLSYHRTELEIYKELSPKLAYNTSYLNNIGPESPIYTRTVSFSDMSSQKVISIVDTTILQPDDNYIVKIRNVYKDASNADVFSNWKYRTIRTSSQIRGHMTIPYRHNLDMRPKNHERSTPIIRRSDTECYYRPNYDIGTSKTYNWYVYRTRNNTMFPFSNDIAHFPSSTIRPRYDGTKYDGGNIVILDYVSGEVRLYSIYTKTWTTINSIPNSANGIQEGQITTSLVNNDVYMYTGYTDTGQANLYKLDKTTNTWTTSGIAQGLSDRGYATMCWIETTKLAFVFGRKINQIGTGYRNIAIYDILTDTWTYTSDAPGTAVITDTSYWRRPNIPVVELYDRKIAIPANVGPTNAPADLLYDGWSDTWHSSPSLIHSLSIGSGTTMSRGVYVYQGPNKPTHICKLFW